jgi:hypothetical protein
MNDLFEDASRQKLTFATSKGALTVYDLWDLQLKDLDTLAKAANKALKTSEEESFIPTVGRRTKEETLNALRLNILKRVIKVKVEEAEKATQRAIASAKRARIKELMAQKEDEAFKGKSLDELQKLLGELGGDE